jgi:hypothetical protein
MIIAESLKDVTASIDNKDSKTLSSLTKNNKIYTLYNIETYDMANNSFIQNEKLELTKIKRVKKLLQNNEGYHFRIHKNTQYVFFGDLDNYAEKINIFINKLQSFLDKNYNLQFEADEFKYTRNNKNKKSYHYSIPKWNLKTEKLKEIHTNFLKMYKNDFTYNNGGTVNRNVDTTIYSEHWFRCPNQKKGTSINDISCHLIKHGIMEDFIIDYIPKDSIDINNFVNKNETINDDKIITKKQDDTHELTCAKSYKSLVLSTTISQPNLYKKMFDECYKKDRFEVYEYWLSIGMALKNTFSDEKIAFDLFNYFSSKGNNYEGIVKTEKKFNSFIKKQNIEQYTVATIYFYAIEDNKLKFIEIMNKNTFDLEQSDICKYIKVLAGKKYIYIVENNIYKLYCYDGKIWKNDDILMKSFISNELYDFLKMILVELYFEHYTFNKMKNQIKKLKSISFKKDIVETYKEVGTDNTIKFDDKWYLLGFDNIVYDLEQGIFRDYKYDDYQSTTVGYDWRDPTITEVNTVNKLISEIIPIEDERELYLQILCSALDGKCLEKFNIL